MAYDTSGVDDLLAGGRNPAAPKGLKQTARAGQGQYSTSGVDDLLSQQGQGYADSAQSWYNGANVDGTENGWSTQFMSTAFQQMDQAQQAALKQEDPNTAFDWYKRDDATGVVTWNDPTDNLFAGDVFKDGQKVGNVYDDYGQHGGDRLLAKFMFDAKTQQQMFEDPDERRVRQEVRDQTEQWTQMRRGAERATNFNDKVEKRQEKLLEGEGEDWLTAGGAAGGAVLGGGTAAAAFSWTGPGALVAGAIGFVGGGLAGAYGAEKNKDLLTEQYARAQEITARANKKYGDGEAFTVGMGQYSQVGLRMINPISNIVQGVYDDKVGKVGDGQSEFYAMDKDGTRKRSGWMATADVAATLSDSVLQFSNPLGVGLYMAGTGAHVVGQVGTMSQTGAGWDDRTASFNEYDGAKEWGAAVGNVGIDVVQFGFAGALAKAGAAGRAAVTANATPGVVGRGVSKLRDWTGMGRAAGTEVKTIQGMRFTVDKATDTALSARPAMTILAPSEAIRWVPTSWMARNRTAMTNGAAGPDDYYKAALELAGGNRFGSAMVNGWAEGTEEMAQAVLEPVSFSADVRAGEVFEAYFYGMAAGAGMSLGQVSRPPSNDQVASYRAQTLYQMRNQTGQLTDEEWGEIWSGMGRDEKKRMALPSPEETESIRQSIVTLHERAKIDHTKKSTLGMAALSDLMESAHARDLAHVNPNADNVLQLAGMSGDKVVGPNGEQDVDLFPANAGVASTWQTVKNVVDINRGLKVQSEALLRDIEDLERELQAVAGDLEESDRISQRIAELDAEVQSTSGLLAVSDAVTAQLDSLYDQYRVARTVEDAEAMIDAINGLISSAFHGRFRDEGGNLFEENLQEFARRSVEMKFARHPIIGKDSFVILLPQASKALSRANAHGQLHTHQAGLKALGADRDGDTMISQNFVSLPQAQLDALRAGTQYIASMVNPVEVAKDKDGNPVIEQREEFELVTDLPDGEALFVSLLHEGWTSSDPTLKANAETALIVLQDELYARYAGAVEDTLLIRTLDKFYDDVLNKGDVNARMKLANTLFNAAPQELGYEFGKRNGVPEMMWLWQRISLEWDRHQRSFAANDVDLEFTPGDVEADLPTEKAYLRSRAIEEAASDGQTMAVLLRGDSPVRIAQKAHYSVFRSATALARGDYTSEQVNEFIELFAQLGSNMGQSELARVRGRNAIQKRVAYWLEQIAAERTEMLGPDSSQALMLLANTQVRDVRSVGVDAYEVVEGDITLLQLLLRRSVEIEVAQQRQTIEQDEDLKLKVNRLERLSRRDPVEKEHSTTAQLALFEVFGSHQLFDLLGDSSKYLGPHLTMRQLSASIADLTNESRQARGYRWKRKAPYLMHGKLGNPPYTEQEVTSGQVSAYRITVDAILADAHTAPRTRRDRDRMAYNELLSGLNNLRDMIQSYRTINSVAHSDTGDQALLEKMLEENPSQLATAIAGIIPDAARLGAFEYTDGAVYAAPWVLEMLVQPAEQAALTYRVQTWLAEWSQMSEKDREYGKIQSRFLQTLSQLAHQPDGLELNRLLLALNTATSLPSLMETINNEPMWRGDRAELFAFFDDVAEFEADPSQIWTANMPGQLQREALTSFKNKTSVLSQAMAEYAQTLETETNLLTAVENYAATKVDRDDGKKFHQLLKLAIENRVNFSDHAGPRMRDAALAKIQSGVLKLQDKGKADPAIAPLGEILVTTDEFGVKQSVMQTVDALTKYDPEDIITNPTLLAAGPVLVGLRDGSEVEVNLSTVEGALKALQNEATNAFAKRVLFPVARDVNTMGVVQHYQDVSSMSLKTMLEEQNFTDVFVPLGERLSVAQANKYISMVEAGVRKAAIGKSEKEEQNAYFPIQQILNEFVVAYSHRVGANTRDQEQVRRELIVDVATALQAVSALDAQEPSGHTLLERVRETLQATLNERFLRDNSALKMLTDDAVTKAAEDVLVLDAYSNSYIRKGEELKAKLADPDLTPAERTVYENQFERLTEVTKERIAHLEQLGKKDTVRSAISMFSLTGEEAVDLERKAQIRDFLKAANRVGRFQGNYMLLDKVNAMLAYEPTAALDSSKITDDEWTELGSYAATVYLAELAGHAGSSVNLTPLVLGPEGETMRRYFDASWSYLLDGLFNPQMLEVAQQMARQAKWEPAVNPSTVAGLVEGTLFSDKKLGSWTEMVVYSSLQARQALAAAPVGLAIPAGGVLPVTQGAYAGAGRSTFAVPPADALTTMDPIRIETGADQIEWTLEQYVKLNNHFAGRVVLSGYTVDGNIEVDLMPRVGQAWVGDPDVAESQYKVISIGRLNEAITEALLNTDFVGDPELQIDYFDVDTQPHHRTWANNIFYTGVGRDRALSTAPSPISEMVFSTGGVSKKAQQGPLDTATKSGKGYKATPVTHRETTVTIETAATSVADLLRRKVLHLLNKDYDIGNLQPGDSTTLYKLMKQRHVIVGENAEGETEAWWSEAALAWESESGLTINDESFPLKGAKVVALTDRQAQTLLGEPGELGVPGVLNQPVVNLDELDIFPSLSAERLAEVGITKLGQRTTLDKTPFAGPGHVLTRMQWTGDKDASRFSRYEEAIYKFREAQVAVRTARVRETSFPISKINQANSEKLRRMLGVEALAPLFARLNIPFLNLRDLQEVKLSQHLQAKLEELQQVNPSSVIWNHVQGASLDIAAGVLSEVVTTDNFGNLQIHERPTYEDTVVIDLDSFTTAAGGDFNLAYDLAKGVIRKYTRLGVTIVLAHGQGGTTLRTDLARHLQKGAEGYDRMAESAHFFAPINAASGANQTRRSLESTLTSVQQITAESIVANFVSDRFGDTSSENATLKEYQEGRPEQRTEAVAMFPTQISHIYGVPVQGVGMMDQFSQVRERSLELLESPMGRDLLKKLAGGDPKDVPIHSRTVRRDGTVVEEPGIRSIEAAMDKLRGQLEANTHPLTVGQELMIGDLVPLIGTDDTILFLRYGFTAPNVLQLAEQVATPAAALHPGDEMPARVAVSPAELAETWTARSPATIMSMDPDHLVGRSMVVRYSQNWLGKWVTEADGFKSSASPMPNDLAGPVEDLSDINGLRINTYMGRKAVESKQAVTGQITNFRWAFALSGIDFKRDMVEYLTGKRDLNPDELALEWSDVHTFLDRVANLDDGYTASQITEMLDSNSFMAVLGAQLNALAEETLGTEVFDMTSDTLFDRPTDANKRLGQVLLASLLAPGVRVEDVISTSGILGLGDLNSRAQITLMPELFTDALNDFNYPALREMLFNRINARLPRRPDGTMPYKLRRDWKFQVRMRDPRNGVEEGTTVIPDSSIERARMIVEMTDGRKGDEVAGWASKLEEAKAPGTAGNLRSRREASLLEDIRDTGFNENHPIQLEDLGTAGKRPKILDGHHRLITALELGLPSVPYTYKAADGQWHYGTLDLPQPGGSDIRGGYTTGVLQLSLELPADENPTTYTAAGIRRTRGDVSAHVAMTTWETIGGRTAIERRPTEAAKIFSTKGIEKWSDSDSGGYWQMLRAVPKEDASYKVWHKQMPAQRLHIQAAHEKVVHYLKPLDTSEWSTAEATQFNTNVGKFLEELNINEEAYRTEVDYLVRQFSGRPAAHADQDPEVGRISGALANQVLELMLTNVRKHRVPTYGGVVPLPHETFLALVFRANEGHPRPWAPVTSPRRRAPLAKDWTEWVNTTFGQVLEAKELFSSTFRQDLDGFMHTYQSATEDLMDLPVSMDDLTNVKLQDKETNLYLSSLDPYENALLTDPIILETMKATLDTITGHQPAVGMEMARVSGSSDLAKTIDSHARWLKTKQVTKEKQQSIKHYAQEGAWYIESSRDTHSFFHNMVNLSVGMRLLNPALWTSAVVEVWVRNALEGMTNVAQGRTSMLAGVSETFGGEPVLSREDLKKFRMLSESMGQDNRFLAIVYDELMYRNLVEAGRGKIGSGLESFAKFSAKATSDPKFGMLAKTVAKRYNEAAWEYLSTTDNAITVDAYVAKMNRDPLWLAKQFEPNRDDPTTNVPFNPHRAGLNRIAQTRSVKASLPSHIIMGGIDALARNPKFRYNALGHLIKIPFLFTRFNANALITMSGMGGFDQFFSMAFDQRQSKLIGRIKAGMSGREYNPEDHDRIDLTDVIEGVDLVRPFIKGAITHTGLMAMGMAAGGLGLSGEDEESKRRRRLAEYLGTPYYYDPRQAQNDFTNADAVFMEFLPGPLESLFRFAPGAEEGDDPRSAAVPHWVLRQFISPVIGIERFFETGDVRQVKWGFADAFGVLPNSVSRLWQEASMTGDMLAESARKEDVRGETRNTANATQFLISMVGVYERALFENSFINAWRNGSDQYNRDPWTLPMLKNGEIKTDKLGNPVPTDARSQYKDQETKEIREGYTNRTDWSAQLHQFAENNFTAAALLSLTTGQLGTDSTFWRKNMVVDTQEIELPPADRAEAEALLLSALEGTKKGPGALPSFTQTEVEGILKANAQKAGKWWVQSEISAEAAKIMQDPKYGGLTGAMSLWDKDGREVLTKEGARGVLHSLSKGMIQLGDEGLRGVWIPYDMRVDISKDWARELVQEGLNLGLDEYTATARAKRLWYGNGWGEEDRVGIEELIWSDQIPKDGKVVYNQLNTTYTMGPDGRPWATPWGRGSFVQALGIPWPHRAVVADQGGMTSDSTGNSVDTVTGINTGLKALQRVETSWQIEKPEGLFDEALKDMKKVPAKAVEDDKGSSGWVDFGKNGNGWVDFGSGGSSGGGSGAYFTKMYSLPDSVSPYGNSAPFINTSNPIIRRADVRRERVWSERGRLKQWQ